jgi:hypothetical protein
MLRSSRTYREGLGGGSGDGERATAVVADGNWPASGRRGYEL